MRVYTIEHEAVPAGKISVRLTRYNYNIMVGNVKWTTAESFIDATREAQRLEAIRDEQVARRERIDAYNSRRELIA